MEQEAKRVTDATAKFWGSVVQDTQLEQLTMQLQQAEGKLETLNTSLKVISLLIQITNFIELKSLQQWVAKERERQQRCSAQLDEFQEIGAQLSIKAVSTLKEAKEGKKDIAKKMVENLVTRDLMVSQEIAGRFKKQVKAITQQYEDFKLNITEYTMSSQHGSRASHKIVLGDCWKGILG